MIERFSLDYERRYFYEEDYEHWFMDSDENGDYVQYVDYLKLQEYCTTLEAKLKTQEQQNEFTISNRRKYTLHIN